MARILIVDDASFMRGTLKYIVETAQHSVVGVGRDGGEALKLYTQLKPDLVLMDILMEGTDGLTALKTIREEDTTAKVIMVTALGQEQKQEKARKLGASGYIRKPFQREEIINEIDRVMSKDEG